MSKSTNVSEFMGSLGGGVTEKVLSKVLTDTAMAVLVHGAKKTGKVVLELTIDKMSEDSETGVKVNAKLAYKMPTQKGSKQEDETRESVFFMDPQKGLVDTPPKAKDDGVNPSMGSALPAGTGFQAS